jgi:hypothetical protein
MLSQVSDAGDQATGRGRLGAKLYSDLIEGNIADRLSVDDRKKAMREIDMLGDSMQFGSLDEQMQVDPLTGDRVATIIEKYMADAGDGVPAAADGLLGGESPPAEIDPMMELVAGMGTPAPRTPVRIEELPNTAPRIPVNSEQLAPLPSPALDASAMDSMEREIRGQDEGLAGLMAGQMAPIRDSDVEEFGVYRPGMARAMTVMDEMNRSPSTQRPEGTSQAQNEAFTRMMKSQLANEVLPRTGQSPEETFRIFMENDTDAINRIYDQQRGPSGREFERRRGRMTEGGVNEGRALALGSTFIPATMLPAAAAQIGMRTAQIAQYLRAGKVGQDALRRIIQEGVAKQGGRVPGRRSRGPVQGPAQPPMQGPAQPPMQGPAQPQFPLPTQYMTPGAPMRTGGLARGGAVRDNIMNTYGRM